MCAVETPSFALQNKTYGAEITRRAITNLIARGSTIGSIAGGLIGAADLAITVGSGLHVIVATGEAWVPGSSSATQSGYYSRVSSSTELAIATANPSLPRIDRVSALVKDEAYTGSENLFTVAVETGTATAGATLSNLNGVTAAPTSSMTLGYVLVPAGATSLSGADISQTTELVTTGIPPLRVVNGATEPVSGQISEVATGTVTLPVPKLNTIVGAFNAGASTVTVSSATNGGSIYGDFTVAATSLTLLAYQHLLLVGDGTNWLILAGEPKRTQTYSATTIRTVGTEYEPSATRPTFVALTIDMNHGGECEVLVGGVKIHNNLENHNTEPITVPCNLYVPPGQKWRAIDIAGTVGLASSYLTL